MKRAVFVMVGLSLMAVSQAFAAVATELFLDAGGGITATIDVDSTGLVTCNGTGGGCASLSFANFIVPHTTLIVQGSIGQFSIVATGVGGLSTTSPTLQNLNQINATSSGAGTLFTEFSDTDYCLGGGGCFGNQFDLAVSNTTDIQIQLSSINFGAFVDAGNTVGTGTPIGSFTLTGHSSANSGLFANPIGLPSGSLSTATSMNFTGTGQIQANFTVATIGTVPEPASIMLLGAALGLVSLKLRRKFTIS